MHFERKTKKDHEEIFQLTFLKLVSERLMLSPTRFNKSLVRGWLDAQCENLKKSANFVNFSKLDFISQFKSKDL